MKRFTQSSNLSAHERTHYAPTSTGTPLAETEKEMDDEGFEIGEKGKEILEEGEIEEEVVGFEEEDEVEIVGNILQENLNEERNILVLNNMTNAEELGENVRENVKNVEKPYNEKPYAPIIRSEDSYDDKEELNDGNAFQDNEESLKIEILQQQNYKTE